MRWDRLTPAPSPPARCRAVLLAASLSSPVCQMGRHHFRTQDGHGLTGEGSPQAWIMSAPPQTGGRHPAVSKCTVCPRPRVAVSRTADDKHQEQRMGTRKELRNSWGMGTAVTLRPSSWGTERGQWVGREAQLVCKQYRRCTYGHPPSRDGCKGALAIPNSASKSDTQFCP